MQVTLHYRLAGIRSYDRPLIKIAKAIVSGHERLSESLPGAGLAHGRIKSPLLSLTLPAQCAEAANRWMEFVAFRNTAGDEHNLDMWDLRMLNSVTLILRCGAILIPDLGPNGGYRLINGGPKGLLTTVIPRAKCTRFKQERKKYGRY